MRRSIDAGDFVLLDPLGGEEFTEGTVPVGTQSVSVAVKSKRGTRASGCSESLVAFAIRGVLAGFHLHALLDTGCRMGNNTDEPPRLP